MTWAVPTSADLMAFEFPAPTDLDRTYTEWYYNDGRAPSGDYHFSHNETNALYEGGATVRRRRKDPR